ncbi:MAG: hypothetical protein JWP52_1779, partial [Rhizobacter sp.]|nr:hypothetical protein [Rhizobacter sp.]
AATRAVPTTATAGGTVPATRAPRPSGRAAGTGRRHAQVTASRPVATAAAVPQSTAGHVRPESPPSPAACTPSATTRATTPNGPTSGAFITARVRSLSPYAPSPSTVSASPSRCSPRLSTASPPSGVSLLPGSGLTQRIVGGVVLGFVLTALLAAFDTTRRRWPYERLFEIAWRNGVLSVLAVALTGVMWLLLVSGALLMNLIGVTFVFEMIGQPLFVMAANGLMVGAAFALGLARSDTLVAVRRFWLSISSWFLPLVLGFGVMWVVALVIGGSGSPIGKEGGALFLLWFAALAVKFVNSAWQDGVEAPDYPRWLARLLAAAWLSVPVVVGMAGGSLGLRIVQHGWSVDRIWGMFVLVLACGYALGYALSLWPLRRGAGAVDEGRWMRWVGRTNTAMACVMVAGLVLLLGPLADPQRLGVADQMARLRDGRTPPDRFDATYLRWEGGRFGVRALQEIVASPRDATLAAVSGQARSALVVQVPKPAVELSPDQLARKIQLLPAGSALPAALLAKLGRPNADWRDRECAHATRCVVWLTDLDHDGALDALVLTARDDLPADARVYSLAATGALHVGHLRGRNVTIEAWLQAIQAGTAKVQLPRWPDIVIGDQRLEMDVD